MAFMVSLDEDAGPRVATIFVFLPLTYFDSNESSLQFTQDAYKAMNLLRPIGNRIGLVKPKNNSESPASTFIRP